MIITLLYKMVRLDETKKNKPLLKYLIYTSVPVNFDNDSFHNILEVSQQNNIRDSITGALIYRPDLYLQYLEGPVDSIDKTYIRIKNDPRHIEIHQLAEKTTERRLFTSWAMRGDPAKTWMWSYEDVKNGLIKRFSPKQAFSTFNLVSREIDQFN